MAGRVGIVVHGGVGATSKRYEAGCRAAARAGLRVLKGGGSALDAVVAASIVFENDGRFNAGTGSTPRMDGRTVEMDAALMDSGGRIGAVAALRFAKNPIAVARAVMDTPHILLAGEGADRFARVQGLERHPGLHPDRKLRFEKMRRRLMKPQGVPPRWRGQRIRKIWNFPCPVGQVFPDGGGWGCDTIGACAVDREGTLAVANSTGGASPMLFGRVGDSPLPGAGYWAGPAAAVAATGLGEEIARRLLCKFVYDRIAAGASLREACEEGIALFDEATVTVGLIAISRGAWASAANRGMAVAFMEV